MSEKDRPYKVGYKKPPKHSQFKKGQPSANPRGRKKKSRNFAVLLSKALQETVTVVKNGLKKKMTAQEAITLTLVASAIKGNDRAIERIFKLFPEQHPKEAARQLNAAMDLELDALDSDMLNKLHELIKLVQEEALEAEKSSDKTKSKM